MKHLVKKYVKATKVGGDVVEVLSNAPIDEKALTDISEKKNGRLLCNGIN